MTLDHLFMPLYFLGAVGMFVLAPIQKKAGKTKRFWIMLVLGVVFLIMAAANFWS